MSKPRSTKRTTIKWVKRILIVLGALAIVAAIVRALLPKPISVDAVAAARGPLEVEIREDGQTRVRDRFVITAPFTGELQRVRVTAGSSVDAGTVIAQILPPSPVLLDDRTRGETTARLAAARARERQAASTISRARESKLLATREAARTRDLAAKGAVPGTERERADTAEQLAIEDLAAAEQARAAAASEIAALRAILEPRDGPAKSFDVVAPASGRVLRVTRESAGPIAAGAPLVEVGDPSALEVVVDVLSRDAERIRPGMDVDVETGERTLRGSVIVVEPSAFTRISALGVEEQRVNIVVCFDAPPQIGDAFRVDARIIVWRGENVLHIPSGALFRDRGQWAVYAVADGRARLRRIDIGHRGRYDVEVTRGLAAGERVIVHPSDQVRDGARISVR